MIVTNDDDFSRLSLKNGFPPKVILLRIGNHRTQDVAELLISKKEEFAKFQNSEFGLLALY